MIGFRKDKNTVDSLLKDLRDGYDSYIARYRKPEKIKRLFEMRYRDAVEYRINLLSFLQAEREALDLLVRKAEQEAAESAAEDSRRGKGAKAVTEAQKPAGVRTAETAVSSGKSYADRMLEEFARRIESYPEIIIHPDASFEMQKLFGALICVEKDYWGVIDRNIRNTVGSRRFRVSVDLDPEVNRMCVPGLDGLPPVLDNYHRLLERPPRDFPAIEREEKRCLLLAAGFLKRLQMEVIRLIGNGASLDEQELIRLREAKVYIDGVINDFRLKDLGQLQ